MRRFKLGDRVQLSGVAADGTIVRRGFSVGRVVAFQTHDVGASAEDPFIIVQGGAGKRYGFWTEELEVAEWRR